MCIELTLNMQRLCDATFVSTTIHLPVPIVQNLQQEDYCIVILFKELIVLLTQYIVRDPT